MVARDKVIKIRANEYEKALVAALTAKANAKEELVVMKEADIIRIAINTLARKYLSNDEIEQLRDQYDQG